MIRKAATKALILAAVTLVSGATTVNCSKKSDKDDIGSVGLALTLPGGAIVNTVSYQITGASLTMPITGTIDVSAPGITQATALVSGLAPGSYVVTMTATTTDTVQSCSGTTPFTVLAGQTAMANVILQCTRQQTGTVAINGRLDQCPYITGITATALQATVGSSITVNVSATELDPGDTITYSWTNGTPATGSLSPLNAAMATFTCNAVGTSALSIAVSDGICGDTLLNAIPINCIAGTTGTGGAGPGTGGTGGVAGTGGSGPGTGGSGPGTGGSGPGTGGAVGTGGMGGMACLETAPIPPALTMCSQCIADNDNPLTDGCCGIADPTGLALCLQVSACMRTGGTTGTTCNQAGDVTTCFCGTNQATCDTAGAANGPCVAQVTAAAGRNITTLMTDVPTAAQVLARQGDANYALGRAANIHGIAGVFCPAECGF